MFKITKTDVINEAPSIEILQHLIQREEMDSETIYYKSGYSVTFAINYFGTENGLPQLWMFYFDSEGERTSQNHFEEINNNGYLNLFNDFISEYLH